jgi:3-phenylpropionate/trans-cinnamate dioxygenase ferredoxin reductase subunit
MAGIVIVGGGQAGHQIAAALRSEGYTGALTLVGEEAALPYQRPPLSKGLLLGAADPARLPFRLEGYYQKHAIELLLGRRVERLDRQARRLELDGRNLAYERLALTTGAHVRRLDVPGAEADGVVYLRTLDQALELKRRLDEANEIVVIGGGFIGLEVAASASKLGKTVTVVELAERLMGRVVAPLLSEFFQTMHEGRGVRIVLGQGVREIEAEDGRATAVVVADGRRFPADLVVVGIGVTPADELARDAGLAVENGIVVDETTATSDPLIVAAGDCAHHPNPFAGGARIRLESVQNAVDQAKTAAQTLLGRPARYQAVPWFWSDQFEAKLQMVGFSAGHDEVITRGDPASGAFSAVYYREGRLIAIDSVNQPADHMAGRRLLQAGIAVPREIAADPSRPLKSLLT